jgi:hypothetical protein
MRRERDAIVTGKTLIERLAAGKADPAQAGSPADAEGPEDFGSFGWLRGIRDRAVMLELRKKDGNILAIGYGWLERLEYNPTEGLTLHGVGSKVRIQGRNLNAEVRPGVRLYEGITRHRVPWLQEADEPDSLEADDKATVIERIEW